LLDKLAKVLQKQEISPSLQLHGFNKQFININ
jgi:hypothetical protein